MTKSANSHATPRAKDNGETSQSPEPCVPEHPVRARFLRTDEAATYLGLSVRTLEKHRTYGTGPIYRKLGNRVVYGLEELEAWAELGTRHSTSDPGIGTVYSAKPRAAVDNVRSTLKR